MALTLEGVSYVYGVGTPLAQPALGGVSLSVDPGGLAVVLGPSGSGKTTLLRLAAGLLEPTEGRVLVDGLTARSAARGAVGLAFQRPETQFFAASVEDDVAFGPRNLGQKLDEAAASARDALERVGLDPRAFADRSPFTLSGGEARRVALAGVLAMSPRYLLLDEPTSGLDASGRRAVAAVVEAARARTGIVIVTHDAEEFLGEADSVLVLRGGHAAFEGDVASLMREADRMDAEGAWLPPEAVRVQLLASRKGMVAGPPVLDIDAAALRLTGRGV